MALKHPANKPPALPPAPAWGVVSEGDTIPGILRLECPGQSESLPYHTLTRWTLQSGTDDLLTLYSGNLVITLRGRELAPVRDALDAGRLVSVRTTESRYLPIKTGTVVTGITVASKETA